MKLLSERGFNIHLYPMIQKRGRVFEGDYVKRDSNNRVIFVAKEGSRWNLRCYKFMDWLSTKVRHKFNDVMLDLYPDQGIIKSTYDHRLSEHCCLLFKPSWLLDILNSFNNPNSSYKVKAEIYNWQPVISIKQIAKELKWNKGEVIQILKIISNYKIRTNYHIKSGVTYGNKTQFNYDYKYVSEDFESLFNINIIDDQCSINFKTGYGLCFLHNIYTGGYELVDDFLYKLSENSQIVYRKRFFPYSKITTKLNKKYVVNLLHLREKNITSVNKQYKKIIEELTDFNLIDVVKKISNDCFELKRKNKKERKILSFSNKKVRSN